MISTALILEFVASTSGVPYLNIANYHISNRFDGLATSERRKKSWGIYRDLSWG
jgi:hypothetical protein